MPSRIWRPYTQEQTATPSLHCERAFGSHLFLQSGQRLFDGISSWWVTTHGHCHPEIIEAVRSQASRIDQVCFANVTHDAAETVAELLGELAPAPLRHAFFTDNGSTAVEAALKMALQACAQRGYPEKTKFIAFSQSYHGDTVGAMSVGGASAFTNPYRPVLFDVLRADQSNWTHDFERLIAENHASLAGVIVEPLIQAAAGMIVWPEEAVRKISALCKQYGVYLIFDEVMTGFGRTGELFAMNKAEVVPDIVCVAKGLTGGTLPLAVTLASDEIYEAFLSNDRARMLFHGHSFTANPIACAAASASLRLFQRGEWRANAAAIAKAHAEGLARLGRSVAISNPRVCGTLGAAEIEVPSGENNYVSDLSTRWTAAALEHGLYFRPLGNTVYLLPPYCSTPDEILEAWDVIARVVRE